MEKKEVAVDNPLTVAGLTIIPVVQVVVNYWQAKGSTLFFGLKQPVAVIVVSPSAKRGFRISGEEIPIDQLVEEAPGLKEILAGL